MSSDLCAVQQYLALILGANKLALWLPHACGTQNQLKAAAHDCSCFMLKVWLPVCMPADNVLSKGSRRSCTVMTRTGILIMSPVLSAG